ncbi:MAG: LamG-like jellyroll fold domain-containing protein [Vicingaceae bacterium]
MKFLYAGCLGLFFLPLSGFSQCQPVPSNAIAWWDADNYSGSVVLDIRGGFNGQLMNGATIDTGYVCEAFDLDGTDDHVSIAHNSSLTFSDGTSDQAFSIEAWINLKEVSTSMIFCKGEDKEREYSFRLTGTIADHLAVGLYDDRRSTGGNYNVIGRRSVYDFKQDQNSWVHVACTYDGSGISSGIKLYRNGVEIPTTVLVGTDSLGIYSAMRTTTTGATIGRFFTDGPQYLDGKVDELSVYSRVLSATEIDNIYLAGTNGKCILPIDNDTSGCHGDPFVSVESFSAKTELISSVNSLGSRAIDIVFNSSRSGTYSIFTVQGKNLGNANFSATNVLSINLEQYASSIYLIQVRTDNGEMETVKWRKE